MAEYVVESVEGVLSYKKNVTNSTNSCIESTEDNNKIREKTDLKEKTNGIFKLHVLTKEITDKKVIFQIIEMIDSIFIIVNYNNDMHFSDLSVAVPTKYNNLPISTNLMGDFVHDYSKNLALKLSRRLKKSVFLSCNIDADRFLLQGVESVLHKELQKICA